MPAQKLPAKRTISESPINIDHTAELLEKVAKELYENNLALNKERSRLDEILLSIIEAIYGVNNEIKLTLFNQRADEVFEFNKDEAINKKASKTKVS